MASPATDLTVPSGILQEMVAFGGHSRVHERKLIESCFVLLESWWMCFDPFSAHTLPLKQYIKEISFVRRSHQVGDCFRTISRALFVTE
jgi:hypothetical protein